MASFYIYNIYIYIYCPVLQAKVTTAACRVADLTLNLIGFSSFGLRINEHKNKTIHPSSLPTDGGFLLDYWVSIFSVFRKAFLSFRNGAASGTSVDDSHVFLQVTDYNGASWEVLRIPGLKWEAPMEWKCWTLFIFKMLDNLSKKDETIRYDFF